MGANAQTTVPTFTAGQVLTAAQMNESARTGVPVFANTSARDAGFGGTGEKTLAEGQLCYLEDANVVQYYDGSTWATVGPTTPATPGLELVKTQTIGANVSSVIITSAFSATYDDYLVLFDGLLVVSGGTNQFVNAQLRVGSTTTGTAYYSGGYTTSSYAGSLSANFVNNGGSWPMVAVSTATGSFAQAFIRAPYLTTATSYTVHYAYTGGTGNLSGYQSASTSFDQLVLTPTTNNLDGGTVRIYGFKI
jgi:hypothetical protein